MLKKCFSILKIFSKGAFKFILWQNFGIGFSMVPVLKNDKVYINKWWNYPKQSLIGLASATTKFVKKIIIEFYFLTILLLFCNYFISTYFAHSNYLQSCNGRIYESYLPAISKNLGSFRGFFLLFSYYCLIDNQILLLRFLILFAQK